MHHFVGLVVGEEEQDVRLIGRPDSWAAAEAAEEPPAADQKRRCGAEGSA
jgi:hypothetical protein